MEEKERGRTVDNSTEDPEFSEHVRNLIGTVEKRERPGCLPVGTRHLIWAVVECAVKLNPAYIKSHIKIALDNGYTPQQILEALEVAVPPTGYPSFLHGLNVLKEVVKERTK